MLLGVLVSQLHLPALRQLAVDVSSQVGAVPLSICLGSVGAAPAMLQPQI